MIRAIRNTQLDYTVNPDAEGQDVRVTVRLSEHAVGRYQERVKPALDLESAGEDLIRHARSQGRVSFEPPP